MQIKIRQNINNNENALEEILQNRGLDSNWINAGEGDLLDFSIARNYQAGKDLILKHIANKSNIGILVDSDADGLTSAGIMHQWLLDKDPSLNIQAIIPEGKVHGILEQLIPKDISFLIIPDASSSEAKKHKIMSDRNIEVLILDHHEMENEDPWSVIINPKNPLCTYPNESLSGGGVTWKFIRQIDIESGSEDYRKYIDLVAIGLVGDVMSLKPLENKAIVNMGTKKITNPYFKAYLKADKRVFDKSVNPILIAFYMVPLVNALIRVGDLEQKVYLYEALIGNAPPEPIIAEMISVKGKQDRKKDGLVPRIVMNLQKAGRDTNKIIFGESPVNMPKSMTGLVAGTLCGMYQKPTMLAREDGDYFVGSLRSLNDSTVSDFKGFCEDSGLFEFVGGHASAAGFKIHKDKIDQFLNIVEEKLPKVEKVLECDFALTGDKGMLIASASQFEDHIGCDIKEILMYDEINVSASNMSIIGKNSNVLKIVDNGVTYIKFGFKGELPTSPKTLRIVGKPNLNEWAGDITPQVMIEAMEYIDLQL